MADLTPITREEKIIAGEDIKPVTREEKILAGMGIVPVTRREKFLKAFGGGGSGGDEEELKITDASYLFYYGARIDDIDKILPLIMDCGNFSYMFYRVMESGFSLPQFDTSKGTNFSHMFDSCRNLVAVPRLDTSNGTDFSYMLVDCDQITTIPSLDTSKGTNFSYMFQGCERITTIPSLDTSKGTNFNLCVNSCTRLTTITRIDLDAATSLTSMFAGCAALTNLYLYNIRRPLQIGSGTSWGHLLTVDSLVHTIKELCTVTSTQKLTIGSANLEKIANLYCKITDDTHEKKPMELCESTDEGAMTLTDYATLKGWQIL